MYSNVCVLSEVHIQTYLYGEMHPCPENVSVVRTYQANVLLSEYMLVEFHCSIPKDALMALAVLKKLRSVLLLRS